MNLITYCEGTDKQGTPYSELFGYDNFTDFSKHPNIKVTKNGYTSTAAGRYQILYRTYLSLGGGSFRPVDQDNMAIALIKRRGAYQNVLKGEFETAIKKCATEWASLPGSPYGQPTVKLSTAMAFLNKPVTGNTLPFTAIALGAAILLYKIV